MPELLVVNPPKSFLTMTIQNNKQLNKKKRARITATGRDLQVMSLFLTSVLSRCSFFVVNGEVDTRRLLVNQDTVCMWR